MGQVRWRGCTLRLIEPQGRGCERHSQPASQQASQQASPQEDFTAPEKQGGRHMLFNARPKSI